MESTVLASDVDVGDTIVLPGVDEPVLVLQVRMGRGGLIFTVAPAGDGKAQGKALGEAGREPEREQVLKLTARVRVRQRGRDLAV